MDILINYLQQNQGTTFIYVKYATLSEYFSAVMATPNITYPTNYGGDFFPLFESLYWTGYYTSRTELKGLTRQGEAVSHIVEPLFSLAKILLPSFNPAAAFANITALRLANGDAQHHDGVTGTSEPNVVMMYENDLRNGMSASLSTTASILSSYITKGLNSMAIFSSNQALLSIVPGQTIAVVIYNSLGWQRDEFAVLPVNTVKLSVVDAKSNTVPSQVSPNNAFNATGKYNLFFQTNIPPFGFQTYFVVASASPSAKQSYSYETEVGVDTMLTNGYLTVTLSGTTGRISNVSNLVSGISVAVDQNIMDYTSLHSGAYAFAPTGDASPVSSQPPSTVINQGPLVSEAYQVFPTGGATSFVMQNIRLYKTAPADQIVSGYFEIEHTLGVLPSHTELVSAFSTSIQNEQIFATDDNGFEFLEREALYNIGIEGNYYPSIYASYIKDTVSQLSLIFERSHGVSSLENGEIEVMLHRNPDMGDNFGPALTDTTIVFPVVQVVVDTPAASTLPVRKLPYLLNFPLTPFFGTTPSVASWASTHVTTAQFISSALPPNIHFLSLYALDGTNSSTSIFRLTHLFAVGEDPVYSLPVTVDVGKLFSNFKIASFVETTLTGNTVINTPTTPVILIMPKEIRTFIIEF
jgi:hypothetical protein